MVEPPVGRCDVRPGDRVGGPVRQLGCRSGAVAGGGNRGAGGGEPGCASRRKDGRGGTVRCAPAWWRAVWSATRR